MREASLLEPALLGEQLQAKDGARVLTTMTMTAVTVTVLMVVVVVVTTHFLDIAARRSWVWSVKEPLDRNNKVWERIGLDTKAFCWEACIVE